MENIGAGEQVQPTQQVESNLTPEQQTIEQEARDRYNKSVNPEEVDPNAVPEGYNPDGTPIEKEEINWETKYQELEIQHQLATNPNAYRTESGVYDATEIINDFKATGVLSEEYRQELLETGLTNEQIDGYIEQLKGTTETQQTTNNEQTSFNVKKFEEEFATTGALSEDSYKELEKFGFSKRDVDIYLNGQVEIARNFTKSLFEMVGGEESYNELVQWSSTNLDKTTIERYNEAVKTNDRETIKSIVEFAKFKKEVAGQQKPVRLNGDAVTTNAFAPFKSKVEWQRAQTNPNYGRDMKYTNMVDNRYLASRRAGLI